MPGTRHRHIAARTPCCAVLSPPPAASRAQPTQEADGWDRIRKAKCRTPHCVVATMPSTSAACKQTPRHRCPLLPPSSAPCCKRKAASSQLPPAHQFRSRAPTAALPACNTAPGCNPGFNPESSSWGGHLPACAVLQGSVPDAPKSGSALHHRRLLLLPGSCRGGTRVGVALLSLLVAFEETKLDQENGAPRAAPCTVMMHRCCGWSTGLQGAQLQVWMLLRAQCRQWLQNPTLLRRTKLSATSQRADAESRLALQILVIRAQKGAGMQMEVSSWRWLQAAWGAGPSSVHGGPAAALGMGWLLAVLFPRAAPAEPSMQHRMRVPSPMLLSALHISNDLAGGKELWCTGARQGELIGIHAEESNACSPVQLRWCWHPPPKHPFPKHCVQSPCTNTAHSLFNCSTSLAFGC